MCMLRLIASALARRPKAAILGSRQQMCQNPAISKLPCGAINQACRAVAKSGSCGWRALPRLPQPHACCELEPL